MKLIILQVIAFTTLLLVLHCGTNTAGVGTGEETTNGRVYGMVVDSCTEPVEGAVVTLTPALNDPVKDTAGIVTDTTDSGGRYHFSGIGTGVYTVASFHSGRTLRAMVSHVNVSLDTVGVSPLKLSHPGTIRLRLPANVDAISGYVYLPGTAIFTYLTGNAEWVTLDSVPAGCLPSVAYAEPENTAAAVIRYNIPVTPGDTTVVYYPSWKYAQRLILNTTTSGADVSGDVCNIPVLVRLTTDNFSFTRAKTDGSDLRFIKADGSALSFELARWDGANGVAEVWVGVDTVRGNSDAQYITMLWGNPSASSESNSAAVFDSSGGFEGVWHLNETSGMSARDASRNGLTGTYRGGLPRGEPGPMGFCQNIARPDTDYIDIGNELNPGMENLAIGVWVKRRSLGTQQAIVAKTNGNAPSAAYGFLFNFDSDNLPHLYIATGSGSWADDSTFDVKTDLAITDSTTWHYVFVTVDRTDNALCKMYIDGIDRTGVVGGDVTGISAISNTASLHIGTESDNNCSFPGSIAGVTVAFTTRSADWVKLCYMNQKEQDALVQW